jgi:hypothetical protein
MFQEFDIVICMSSSQEKLMAIHWHRSNRSLIFFFENRTNIRCLVEIITFQSNFAHITSELHPELQSYTHYILERMQ